MTAERILVTGGAGFLGSHLVMRLLALGHNVVCLDDFSTGRAGNLADHARLTVIRHDVCDPFPAGLRADAIFNLACPASPARYQLDPIRTMRTSVLGALNVLELARMNGARVLQASTSEVYGDPLVHPQAESYLGNVNPIGPRACYDEGKRAAEALFSDYARMHGVDIRIARIFNTYGPGMAADDGRVIPNFIMQALRNRPLTVNGTGQQTRALCYVDDMIDGLIALMWHDPRLSDPVNLGCDEEITVIDIARRIISLTGAQSRFEELPVSQDDPVRRCPDLTRAKTLLNWRPKVALDDGLQRTISYFRTKTQGMRP